MKQHMRAMGALALGLVLGTWIWLASPVVTGRAEPWDDRGWYYVTALAVCGLAGGLAARRWWWPAVVGTVVGVYLGQAAVMFPRAQDGGERAPWWAGALLLAAYMGITLAGALVGVAARWIGRRLAAPRG